MSPSRDCSQASRLSDLIYRQSSRNELFVISVTSERSFIRPKFDVYVKICMYNGNQSMNSGNAKDGNAYFILKLLKLQT